MTSAQEIVDRFEQYAPRSLAVPGDPIGWQLGNPEAEVKKVLVTLDVRPEVVVEAVAGHFDFIFAHHPAMFVPAHNLDERVPQNHMYAELLRHNITVYGAHTNLDNTRPGMNDWLADALDLTHVQPFINEGELQGMGRIGELETAMSLAEFVTLVKARYQLPALRIVARDTTRLVQKIAILGGSGAKTFTDAQAAGADVLVTGDITYHTGHDMLAADMPVIDAGHHIEQIMKTHVANLLTQWAAENEWAITVAYSRLNTDPFTFM
jgi:dinuclear metal center YbgI/SA1388 family protein